VHIAAIVLLSILGVFALLGALGITWFFVVDEEEWLEHWERMQGPDDL
jgi:hypothetical protein